MTGADSVPPPLVLASGSPRRAEYLSMLGLSFEVVRARVSEERRRGEAPAALVERLAREKAGAVAGERGEALVLGGDTVVVFRGEVLGKPGSEQEAVQMLLMLQGRDHMVYSGLAIAAPGGAIESGISTTRVTFRSFGRRQAREYVDTGEPMDKAGGYGIQGLGAALVEEVEGDYFTVVGLPVPLLVGLLDRVGWHYAFGRLVPANGSTP